MMTREQRDKIDGRNIWPTLTTDQLLELLEFKETRIGELIAEEESMPERGDFGICAAISSLQHDVVLLQGMIAAR